MDVDQQDVLVGTSVSSTPARGSASKTSDTEVSELQKETDGLKMIRVLNNYVFKSWKKSTGHAGTTACSGKICKRR